MASKRFPKYKEKFLLELQGGLCAETFCGTSREFIIGGTVE
tara:strand:- start:118 stop:240 length:123 start_codon:yes stop_codon:yes gene_type:complete